MERVYLKSWYYEVFKTNKRIIHSPCRSLKSIQRVLMRKIFKPLVIILPVKSVADRHCNKKWIMKLDILDFFNSISKEQIYDVISDAFRMYQISDNNQKLNNFSVDDIFSICTLESKLPTGAPTSPYIANLVLKDFDNEVFEFCKKANVLYSRYMDDLFFSADKQYFLSLVELFVLEKFQELGFRINKDKIKYITSNKRQTILNLMVNNSKSVLSTETKRRYRAFFHKSILKFKTSEDIELLKMKFIGHLAYIKSVDNDFYKKMTDYISKLMYKNKLSKNLLHSLHIFN